MKKLPLGLLSPWAAAAGSGRAKIAPLYPGHLANWRIEVLQK